MPTTTSRNRISVEGTSSRSPWKPLTGWAVPEPCYHSQGPYRSPTSEKAASPGSCPEVPSTQGLEKT